VSLLITGDFGKANRNQKNTQLTAAAFLGLWICVEWFFARVLSNFTNNSFSPKTQQLYKMPAKSANN
jgi:hypothetical protein